MQEQEKRLVTLDLLIARTKQVLLRQKKDAKKLKSYKGDTTDARLSIKTTDKVLTTAKEERRALIVRLLKAADADK